MARFRPARSLYLVIFFIGLCLFLYNRNPTTSPSQTVRHLREGAASSRYPSDVEKRDAIVGAFKHSWNAYDRFAFGDDELRPLSRKGANLSSSGTIGYQIIDALDTMLIMGLDKEYLKARNWVDKHLQFELDDNWNTFETTIRVLGGLLSAYHLSSHDAMYRRKATDLANRILPAFETKSGLPLSMVNLKHQSGVGDAGNHDLVSTAEAASLQLEFKYLSHITGDPIYWEKSEKVMEVIKNALDTPLVPIYISPTTGKFVSSDIRLGSRGDSYYEYLIKQYLQTNRTEGVYLSMYDDAMEAIEDRLVKVSRRQRITYTSELIPIGGKEYTVLHKQDHLVCFLGGSLLLGVTLGDGPTPPDVSRFSGRQQRDWKVGEDLIEGCMQTHKTATGLSPEIAFFYADGEGKADKKDWYIKPTGLDKRYILRPETVESLFLGYRMTGNEKYRQWGWEIFQAIEKYCKIPTGGYASVDNVDAVPVKHDDRMETFFLGETLKYLYLLFADSSVLPLSENVFNTEAHPFPVFQPKIPTGFS